MKAKVWQLTSRPSGVPKVSDFTIVEEDLKECGDGDIIVAAEYFTVDPYMRVMMDQLPLNATMIGEQVAKVVESKNDKYPVGTYMLCKCGWRSHSHYSASQLVSCDFWTSVKPIGDLGSLPKSLSLGVLGMPGNTAYFGFLEICKPVEGDTVVVNCAAGAVGSAVIQIAKIKGCKVIGFAGTPEKVAWIKELGADYAFNYKTDNVSESIKASAPKGVNCYFDNVGSQFTAQVLPHMADFSRVAICGCIATYNEDAKVMNSPYSESLILWKQMKIEGLIVSRWFSRWEEGLVQMQRWVEEGKIKYKETVVQGFENMPQALIGLFSGENIGKAIVAV
ncbi:unnamed protein product [Meganyctiphanes norvegica]|uniref:Prostaglandin reductase 1 n=1 Tax=Meganyctiphanes norvegica TaxID=48144 RepID=A0AAV2RZL8_MEGNR